MLIPGRARSHSRSEVYADFWNPTGRAVGADGLLGAITGVSVGGMLSVCLKRRGGCF
jgi:hypothetical protein